MLAADTSSFVAYLSGSAGADVELIEQALVDMQLMLPPTVLSELLSDPKLAAGFKKAISQIPLLEITSGFWSRAGQLRSSVMSKGLKARLTDALIAQCCIDNKAKLITRDRDFRHFVRVGSLKLL